MIIDCRILKSRDEQEWFKELAKEAEQSMQQGNIKAVYSTTTEHILIYISFLCGTTKKICNQWTKKMDAVKDKNGKMLSTESEVQRRWQEHFSADPEHPAEVPEEDFLEEPNISEEPLTNEECISTVRELKNGIAAGFDEVSPDLLKADPATTADILERLLRRIWEPENLPEDRRKGLIIKLPKKGDFTKCGN